MGALLTIALAIAAGALATYFFTGKKPEESPTPAARTSKPLPSQSSELSNPAQPTLPASDAPAQVTQPKLDPEFVRRSRAADARLLLDETTLDPQVLSLAADARVQELAALLEERARAGDANANVLLARLQRECLGFAEEAAMPVPARAESADTPVARSVEQWQSSWRTGCAGTRFDDATIRARLRAAADGGDAASLFQLALHTPNSQERRKLLLSAAMLGDPQAQLMMASTLRSEALSGTRPRNEQGADFWLTVAAERLPEARTSLAYCRLQGCNGQPPNPEEALRLIREAARRGEPSAIVSLNGNRSATLDMPAPERYAWTSFHRRLLEQGCYGATGYEKRRAMSDADLDTLGRRLSPFELEQARALTERYWNEHAREARAAQQCE